MASSDSPISHASYRAAVRTEIVSLERERSNLWEVDLETHVRLFVDARRRSLALEFGFALELKETIRCSRCCFDEPFDFEAISIKWQRTRSRRKILTETTDVSLVPSHWALWLWHRCARTVEPLWRDDSDQIVLTNLLTFFLNLISTWNGQRIEHWREEVSQDV